MPKKPRITTTSSDDTDSQIEFSLGSINSRTQDNLKTLEKTIDGAGYHNLVLNSFVDCEKILERIPF